MWRCGATGGRSGSEIEATYAGLVVQGSRESVQWVWSFDRQARRYGVREFQRVRKREKRPPTTPPSTSGISLILIHLPTHLAYLVIAQNAPAMPASTSHPLYTLQRATPLPLPPKPPPSQPSIHHADSSPSSATLWTRTANNAEKRRTAHPLAPLACVGKHGIAASI